MKRGRPAGSGVTASIATLKRELKRREAELKRLLRAERSLRAKLATIERKKASLLGETEGAKKKGKKRRGRKPGIARKKSARSRRRGPSISALMLDIAKERPKGVTPAELADGLLKRGVKTKSRNFRKMIAIAVTRHPGLKRIRQGVYAVKG